MTTNSTHQPFFTADGHLDDNGTSLTVEALILDRFSELPGPITAHIEECDHCKEQVLGLFDLMKEQPLERNIPHPYFDQTRQRIFRFPGYLRIAAVLALALFTGTVFFLLSIRSAQQPPPLQTAIPSAVVPNDTGSSAPERTELFADHFIPSPNLDDLVHSEFRSESIEVLAPETEAIVHSPITFRWKEYPRAVILKVLNNRDITVLTTNVKGNRFVTSKNFPQGLYYWKLEDNGDLLYVGKFFVK